MKSKKLKITLLSIVTIIIILIGGFLWWTSNTYKPTKELTDIVKESDYTMEGDFYVFNPKNKDKKTGIVIYPGALVEPLAYGYYANELSKEGYTVAIPNVMFNLSITENNKAGEFINNHKEIEKWYVGGHSMGGVSAAMFAEDNKELVKGVIFLGSYPSKSTNLSDNNIDVLSIFAENDGLTTLSDIEESKENLPATSVFSEIKNGNHAQFGMYGKQKGDNEANITDLEQQDEMVQVTLLFLEN